MNNRKWGTGNRKWAAVPHSRAGLSVVFALAAAANVQSLDAQPVAFPGRGDRVRVTTVTPRPRHRAVAEFLALRNDTLFLRLWDTADDMAIPVILVHRLDVRAGMRRHWIPFGALGLAVGYAVGAGANRVIFGPRRRDCTLLETNTESCMSIAENLVEGLPRLLVWGGFTVAGGLTGLRGVAVPDGSLAARPAAWAVAIG